MTMDLDAGAPDTPITLDSPLREIWLYCVHTSITKPADTGKGLGWHFPLKFKTIEDLAAQLKAGFEIPEKSRKELDAPMRNPSTIRKGEIVKLALVGHGDSGGILRLNGNGPDFTNSQCRECQLRPALSPAWPDSQMRGEGTGKPCGKCFDYRSIREHEDALRTIGSFLSEFGATLYLFNCSAGMGQAGTLLLETIWDILGKDKPVSDNRHRIIGFNRQAYLELSAVGGCTLLTARVMNPHVSGKYTEYWNDYKNMPRATDKHKCAKIYALGISGGTVVQWPETENPYYTKKPQPSPTTTAEPKTPPKGAQLLKDGRYYRPLPR
jgi:hypothetical protein